MASMANWRSEAPVPPEGIAVGAPSPFRFGQEPDEEVLGVGRVVVVGVDRHRVPVVARVVGVAEKRDRNLRNAPAGEDQFQSVDDRLVVGRQGQSAGARLHGAVLVEQVRADREELEDLTRVVLVRVVLGVGARVEEEAHGRVEREVLQQVAIVAEGAVDQEVQVRRELARPRDRVGRDDVELVEGERHPLAQLVGRVHRVSEERRVVGMRRVVVPVAVDVAGARLVVRHERKARIERRRQRVLRRQPRQVSDAEHAADLGVLRAPGGLLKEPRGLVAVEGLGQEDGHLPARDGVVRAIARAAAAGRDGQPAHFLDVGSQRQRERNVREDSGRRGRHVSRAVVDLQEERRHLPAGHRGAGAVAQGARRAAAGDPLGVELLDPVGPEVGGRDVGEDGPGRRGRNVTRAVACPEEEDRHLRAGDQRGGAVVAAAAARGDPVPDDRLDRGVEGARLRDVGEVGEPAFRQDRGSVSRVRDDHVVESAGEPARARRADARRARDRGSDGDPADRDRGAGLELIADEVHRGSAGCRPRGSVHVGELERSRGRGRRRDPRAQQTQGEREERREGRSSRESFSHRHRSFLTAATKPWIVWVGEVYGAARNAERDAGHNGLEFRGQSTGRLRSRAWQKRLLDKAEKGQVAAGSGPLSGRAGSREAVRGS